MFIGLTIVSGFSMYNHHMKAINFEAEGEVVEARWNTSNHNMSLFVIRNGTSADKKFHFARVTLQPDQIKVGDSFKKESNSSMCAINNDEIQCVE